MGDTTESPEPMPVEEPGSHDSEKIDLSLDEIIKRNKKEQRANNKATKAKNKRLANRNNVLKKLNKVGQQSGFFRRGGYPFQGPYRPWSTGPGFRGFYRRRGFGLSRGAFRGVNPLNRPALNAVADGQFGQMKIGFRRAFSQKYRGRGQALGRGRTTTQFQVSGRGGRPFVLNREFPTARGRGKQQQFQKIRGWRKAPSSGSLLTVSLPNSKVTSEPGARSNSEAAGSSYNQPKGIPLQFNFKAMSNQTSVTLNDRFTSLKIRSQGQRPWRGEVRGRGRGRGRGGERGRGSGGAIGRGGVISRGQGIGRGVGRGGRGRGGRSNRGGGRGKGVRDNRTVTLQS